MEQYSIIIPGRPVPKGRAIPKVIKGKVRMFTPATTRHYEKSIGDAWIEAGHPQLEGPVALDIVVAPNYMQITAWECDELPDSGAIRGDLDNHIKAIDGLNGIAFADDHQVVSITAHKHGKV